MLLLKQEIFYNKDTAESRAKKLITEMSLVEHVPYCVYLTNTGLNL